MTRLKMMTEIAPLLMSPVLAEKPWGGRRLQRYGKALPDEALIGESWEVADLPAAVVTTVAEARSRVAWGPHAGKSLHDLIAEYGAAFMGSASATADGDFPLLVKLLDAREHVSVQVHPDHSYAADHPTARVKSESWYVVDAEPGAHLYLGLRPGTTREAVASRLGTPAVAGLLNVVPATPGDFHHLPAGLVHALGAGVVVAEVQTPSDTTFRVYDWEDRYQRASRPMHGAAALEALRPDLTSDFSARPGGPGCRRLLSDGSYWIREHRSAGGALAIDPASEVRVIMVVAGSVVVDGDPFGPGSTLVIPASAVSRTSAEAPAGSVVLEIGLG